MEVITQHHLGLVQVLGYLIGKRMEYRLNLANIRTISSLYQLSPKNMRKIWGSVQGERFWNMLKGNEVDEITTIIQQAPAQVVAASPVAAPVVAVPVEKNAAPSADDESNYITIKASMIGTFYRSSSPEKPPFVNVGDSINKGDAICIIEAMKLFNEIESDIDGKILKVLVEDSTPVEFDEPLFLIEPI